LLALTEALQLNIVGLTIDTAGSAEAALSALEQYRYDCIICDVLLPGTDGVEFLRRALTHEPEVSVILVTAGEFVREQEALKLGAFAFLTKPLDVELLFQTVLLGFSRTRILRQAREGRVQNLRPQVAKQ
jgi:DNA-binding NtrC family response regulator